MLGRKTWKSGRDKNKGRKGGMWGEGKVSTSKGQKRNRAKKRKSPLLTCLVHGSQTFVWIGRSWGEILLRLKIGQTWGRVCHWGAPTGTGKKSSLKSGSKIFSCGKVELLLCKARKQCSRIEDLRKLAFANRQGITRDFAYNIFFCPMKYKALAQGEGIMPLLFGLEGMH